MMRKQWEQFLPSEAEAVAPIVTHQQTPIRPQSKDSDVDVPWLQAIRTGALVAAGPVIIFLVALNPWRPFWLG